MELAYDRYLTDPFTNRNGVGDCDYENDGPGLMFEHLDEIETNTFEFLQSTPNARSADFKSAFLKESKEW